jgi:hypothetical protein
VRRRRGIDPRDLDRRSDRLNEDEKKAPQAVMPFS